MNHITTRILILDDESFMLRLMKHMLAELGFHEVTTCETAMAGLAWVDAVPDAVTSIESAEMQIEPQIALPSGSVDTRILSSSRDVILLDLNMPEMDGIEFVRKLVERKFEGDLILVSGEDERVLRMAEKLITAHNISVLGHVTKPVSMPKLAELMAKTAYKHQIPAIPKKKYDADELRAAIANGELINFYQPKIDVATGSVIGMETLVRWMHPIDGLVFPDQFISTAEENKLIDELTHAVLRSALAQTRFWHQCALSLRVAINVSMDNLTSIGFADMVATETALAGVTPASIVLEVTESRLMLDQRVPLEVLTRLRLKRFKLSIDDFGTGHSSLTQLRDIPFDELKIDQSFVHGATQDTTARAIYDASLGVGKQLGMTVVAEGVEDMDDWELLRRTGCDVAQGYFIARPMPAADVANWIPEWNERYHGQINRQ